MSPSKIFSAIALAVLASAQFGCASSTTEEADASDQDLTSRRPKAPPPPGEEIFEESSGWTVARDDGQYFQRYKLIDGGIYCETRTTMSGAIPEAVKLLLARWDWYGGTVEDYQVHGDGHRTYRLWPEGKLALVNVTEDMSPPVTLDDGGVRVLIHLEGYGSGTAYIELHPVQGGGFQMLGRFAGVTSNHLPTWIFATLHLQAEGGKLLVFNREGGFAGFKAALARGEGR